MNKIEYIDKDIYLKMWKKMYQSLRIESPNIDPIMKTITTQGLSGEGTDFENEYDRLLYKHYNPDPPIQILMHTTEGLTIYKVY